MHLAIISASKIAFSGKFKNTIIDIPQIDAPSTAKKNISDIALVFGLAPAITVTPTSKVNMATIPTRILANCTKSSFL